VGTYGIQGGLRRLIRGNLRNGGMEGGGASWGTLEGMLEPRGNWEVGIIKQYHKREEKKKE